MPKITSQFVCGECGYASPKWLGRCPACGKFNTLVEESVTPVSPALGKKRTGSLSGKSRAIPLSKVEYERFSRYSSGLGEFDVVLGGGDRKGFSHPHRRRPGGGKIHHSDANLRPPRKRA